MKKIFSLAVCAVFMIAAISSSSFALAYHVTTLQPSQESSMAYSVSDSGQVVGVVSDKAFVWSENTASELPIDGCWFATGNDNGQVCGTYSNSAFLWQNGQLQDLGALSPGYSVALGISDNGRVVGQTRIANGHNHAYVWDGTMHDLGALAADYSCAYDINEAGDVIGWVTAVGLATQHACLWKNGVIHDLGTLSGDTYSTGYGINDLGQVVGDSTGTNGFGKAFIYDNGVMRALSPVAGYTYTCAKAINNSGFIVGYAYNDSLTSSYSDYRPVVWINGIPQLLPTVNGAQGRAFGLNDDGWIVGYIQDGYNTQAVLWQPVPEPTGFFALLAGISCMSTAVRRARKSNDPVI